MLIIFDCDGVLRSASWEGLYKTYIAIAKWAGKDYRDFFPNLELFKKWWNPSWHRNNQRLGIKDYVKETPFHKVYDPYTSVFPWVNKILEEVSKKHILCVLSDGSEKSIKKSLGSRIKYFKLIIGYEHIKKEIKPDPEGINLILEKIKTDPAKSLMIGDTRVDVLAGKRAGTKTGVVSWGLGKWEELLKLKPDYKIEKPGDFLNI